MKSIKEFFKFIVSIIEQIMKGKETISQELKPEVIHRPRKSKKVLIDPGHGRYLKNGNYIWQRSLYNNYREDLLTMQVAQRVKELFNKVDGNRVWWTRSFSQQEGLSGFPKIEEGSYLNLKSKVSNVPGETNYARDVHSRWKYANQLNMKINLDYLISIHFNLSTNHLAHGIEVWVKDDDSSKGLAESIIKNIRGKYPKLSNRGVKIEGSKEWNYKKIAVLRMCGCPAILIECCFYDSGDKKFLNGGFFDRVALSIYESLEAGG